MPKVEYRVYVIELSKKVFTEHSRFRAANPQFNGVLECLYVGMTRSNSVLWIAEEGHFADFLEAQREINLDKIMKEKGNS